MSSFPPSTFSPILKRISTALVDQKATVAIAETTSGGLISAALLSTPGASAWYKGGGVLYTLESRTEWAGWTEEDTKSYKGPTEGVVSKLATNVRERFGTTYVIGESGVAGPTSRAAHLPVGLTCLAIARADGAPVTKSIETGKQDRAENMVGFAQAALELFASVLEKDGVTKGSL